MDEILCFLNKKEYEKIKIIDYISNKHEKILNKNRMAEDLNISNYLLIKLIQEINVDLQDIYPELTISIENGNIYSDSQLKYGSDNLLLKKYFSESTTDKLLMSYLKNDEIIFSERIKSYGWSRSFFFKEKKRFEQNMVYFVGLNPTERTIRLFIYGIYNYFNVVPELQMPTIDEIIQHALSIPMPRVENDLVFQEKISILIIITYYRNIYNHYLSDEGLWIDKLPDNPAFLTLFSNIITPNSEINARFIFQTLLEEGLVPSDYYDLSQLIHNKRSWKLISNIVTRSLQNFDFSVVDAQRQILVSEIYTEIQRPSILFKPNFSDADNLFASVYPALAKYIEHLIMEINQMIPLTFAHSRILYFRLVILLMSDDFDFKQMELNQEYIEICVTFSTGWRTTKWVEHNINDYRYLNIKTTNHLTPTTDIYVSDVPLDHFRHPQVIWNRPTRAQDWYDLEELIRLSKKEKYK